MPRPDPAPTSLRRRGAPLLAAAVMGATLLGAAPAQAASPAPGLIAASPASQAAAASPLRASSPSPRRTKGHQGPAFVVEALAPGTLDVLTPTGPQRFVLTEHTQYFTGLRPATLAALAPSQLVFIGVPRQGPLLQAAFVTVVPASAEGYLTGVSPASLTIATFDGFERTVSLTGHTKYFRDGFATAQTDLATGELARVTGSVLPGGTLGADQVRLGS